MIFITFLLTIGTTAVLTWNLLVKKTVNYWESSFVMGELSYQNAKEIQNKGNNNSQKEDINTEIQNVAIPDTGTQYGEIVCEERQLYAPIYYGDTEEILSMGAGTYEGYGVPGQGETILIGAHDGTYFSTLNNLKEKDIIQVNTKWGNYSYQVEKSLVANVTDTKAYTGNIGETLILYTCYPIGVEDKERTERYFVYAKLIKEEAE